MAKGRYAGTNRTEIVVTKEFYESLKEIALVEGVPVKELLERFFQHEFEERLLAEMKNLGLFKICGQNASEPHKTTHGWDSIEPRTYGWSGWGRKGTKRIYLHLPPEIYRAMRRSDLKKLIFRIKEWRRSRVCISKSPLEQAEGTL